MSPRAALCALALLVCSPGGAAAQGLRDRVFAWAQGEFKAPLVCAVDGTPRQALRRVRIQPGPRSTPRPSTRITFYDLEAPPGTECSNVSSGSEPNVVGVLEVVFEGRNQPDTGDADFRHGLERDGGFTLKISAGHLRVGRAGDPVSGFESFDYTGGVAKLRAVAVGSDAARRLAVFGANRELELAIEAAGAPSLAFDLIELPR